MRQELVAEEKREIEGTYSGRVGSTSVIRTMSILLSPPPLVTPKDDVDDVDDCA